MLTNSLHLSLVIAACTASALSVPQLRKCTPAGIPAVKNGDINSMQTFFLPPGPDKDSRELRPQGGKNTPDASMIYSVHAYKMDKNKIGFVFENKSLVPRGTSHKTLVYAVTIKTAKGNRQFSYALNNIDSCGRVEDVSGIDWSQEVFVGGNLYWQNY